MQKDDFAGVSTTRPIRGHMLHLSSTVTSMPARGPSRYRAYGETREERGYSVGSLVLQMIGGLLAVVATVTLLTMFGG